MYSHFVKENWESHGEEAGTSCYQAIGQAQTLAEIVAEDDQRGLEGERGSTAEQYAICEIAKAQGAARKEKIRK